VSRNYGGNNAATRKRKLPTSGRNVEGDTYVVSLHAGEKFLRCKACGALVVPARWWDHGTSADPHIQGVVG
jgi:hypothetical protein